MRRLALVFVAALFATTSPIAAQTSSERYDGPPPPHVSVVDGRATLERDGRPETAPLNMPLLSGDRLRTSDGRVEVLFGDGTTLHVDASTTVDVQGEDLLRLIDGRLRLQVAPGRQANYRVDSPAGSVHIAQPGEYRVALLHGDSETQLELAVIRGAADIFTDEGTTAVRAGERAYASAGLLPSYTYAFNSAQVDDFDAWSEAQRDARLGASAQYLPQDMRSYAPVFDDYGDWRYAQPYGYVWYPRVASSWRPYYYGRWAAYPRYGWTWIGVDYFSWPTHHYGRWGFSAGAWFWIPGSHWAPAYVSWAYAPGYVSWCPLGFDNRPVFAINIGFGGSHHYSPWSGWTAVSMSHFGAGYVHQRAVNWDRVDVGRRPAFHVRGTPPSYRAATRGSVLPPAAGIRADSASGVRGGSTPGVRAGGAPGVRAGAAPGERTSGVPRYTNRGDAIIRSQTARPVAPQPGIAARGVRPGPTASSTPASGVPQRTAPERPGTAVYGSDHAYQRGRAPGQIDDRGYPSGRNPSVGMPSSAPGYVPPRASPPMRAPAYGAQPAYGDPGGRPRADAPRGVERGGEGIARPGYAPRGAPPSAAPSPQGRPAPQSARPSAGGNPQPAPQSAPRRGRGGR